MRLNSPPASGVRIQEQELRQTRGMFPDTLKLGVDTAKNRFKGRRFAFSFLVIDIIQIFIYW